MDDTQSQVKNEEIHRFLVKIISLFFWKKNNNIKESPIEFDDGHGHFKKLQRSIPSDILKNIIEGFNTRFSFASNELTNRDPETNKKTVSPAILGKIYESILSETERELKGIFYTPDIEVEIMCKMALYIYIVNHIFPKGGDSEADIKPLLMEIIFLEIDSSIIQNYQQQILSLLLDLKVLDPACGSGAFLIGMLKVLIKIFTLLGIEITDNFLVSLISNNLYGMDIKKWALEICNLRFHLCIKEYTNISNLNFLKSNLYCSDALFHHSRDLEDMDIIIGNPPYLRHEKISKGTKIKGKEYKSALIQSFRTHFGTKIGKSIDLYVYFFFRSLQLLRDGGILVFLTSNSFLDVKFGKFLKEILLKHSKLRYIIDTRVNKTFASADVNTVITILEKKQVIDHLIGTTNFISLNVPYKSLLNKDTLGHIFLDEDSDQNSIPYYHETINVHKNDSVRKIRLSTAALWRLGGSETQENKEILAKKGFKDFKWGKFLYAPNIYFNLLMKNSEKFEPLSDKRKSEKKRISSISYGLKTGKNAFFHLRKPNSTNRYFRFDYNSNNGNLLLIKKKISGNGKTKLNKFIEQKSRFEIEKEYWMRKLNKKDRDVIDLEKIFEIFFKDSNGDIWVPNYLIKSPKELDELLVYPKKMNLVLLKINGPKEFLNPGVLEYIEWGESMGFHRGSSCASRKYWYQLDREQDDEVLCMMLINDRYIFPYNKYKLYYDPTINGIKFTHYPLYYLILLNSTLFAFFVELEGRKSLGGGALQLKVYEYENLLTFTIDTLENLSDSAKNTFERILKNPTQLSFSSIFDDLGARDASEISLDKINKGRRMIDEVIFEEILNLSEKEQLEFYSALLEMTKDRLTRANKQIN